MVRVRLREDGPSGYSSRSLDRRVAAGETVDVEPEIASYLVEESGYFDRIDDPRDASLHDDEEAGATSDGEPCGTVMSNDEICDRPADDCPYH